MNGPWTRFIADTADLSVLSGETLDRAKAGLEAEVGITNDSFKCQPCRLNDHCYGQGDDCCCWCVDQQEPP